MMSQLRWSLRIRAVVVGLAVGVVDAQLATCNVGVYSLAGSATGALFPITKVGAYFGIAADLDGPRTRRLYWNEYASSPALGVIRYIDENGGVGVYAGSTSQQGYAEGTLATATLNTIHSMMVDPTNGDLYISDLNGVKIRKVTSAGTTAAAGTTTSAACGGDGGSATGSGAGAQNVMAMVRDPDTGNINFLSASSCHRGRTLTAAGQLAAWVGVASAGILAGNNGPATAATFNYPNGLAMYRDPVTNAKHWFIAVSAAASCVPLLRHFHVGASRGRVAAARQLIVSFASHCSCSTALARSAVLHTVAAGAHQQQRPLHQRLHRFHLSICRHW